MSFLTKIQDFFRHAPATSSATTNAGEAPSTQSSCEEVVTTLAQKTLQQPQDSSQKRTIEEVNSFLPDDMTEQTPKVQKNETSSESIHDQVAMVQQAAGSIALRSTSANGIKIETQSVVREAEAQAKKVLAAAEQQQALVEKMKADLMMKISVCHWNVWRGFTRFGILMHYQTLQQERASLEQAIMKATNQEEIFSLLIKTKQTLASWEKAANESAQPFLVEALDWVDQKIKDLRVLQN